VEVPPDDDEGELDGGGVTRFGIDPDDETLTSFGAAGFETTTAGSAPPTCTTRVFVPEPPVPRPAKNIATNAAAAIAIPITTYRAVNVGLSAGTASLEGVRAWDMG
jgi:hypothetical protein